MPRRLLLAAAFALSAGAVVGAQILPDDRNKDGKVTLAEFAAPRRAILIGADVDGDGKLGTLEWSRQATRLGGTVATRGYPSTGQSGQPTVFNQLDTNGDLKLTPAEIDAGLRERFASLDRNHDGVLSGAETSGLTAVPPR